MTCVFMSFSTVFQSYQDNGRIHVSRQEEKVGWGGCSRKRDRRKIAREKSPV